MIYWKKVCKSFHRIMQYEMKEKNAIEIDTISSTFIFRGP